ncbi:MAG: ETC complex I subunit [Alphaproteobacteria bacterium]|nr:ETC complex I subunit [Alphaproteobacteria bacterium]
MPARARIYQQPKTAMQSGRAGTHEWMLDFEPAPQHPDPLMGWQGGGDTLAQVRLRFETREEAVAYAEREGLAYDVELPRPHRFVPKSYSDNFRFSRREPWSH